MVLYAEIYKNTGKSWSWRIRNRLGRILAVSADCKSNSKDAISEVMQLNSNVRVRMLV